MATYGALLHGCSLRYDMHVKTFRVFAQMQRAGFACDERALASLLHRCGLDNHSCRACVQCLLLPFPAVNRTSEGSFRWFPRNVHSPLDRDTRGGRLAVSRFRKPWLLLRFALLTLSLSRPALPRFVPFSQLRDSRQREGCAHLVESHGAAREQHVRVRAQRAHVQRHAQDVRQRHPSKRYARLFFAGCLLQMQASTACTRVRQRSVLRKHVLLVDSALGDKNLPWTCWRMKIVVA